MSGTLVVQQKTTMFSFYRRTFPAALAFALAGGSGAASALTLYDASANTLPSQQGWFTLTPPGTESVAGGVYRLDTTASAALQGGSARTSPFALDTQAGFVLDVRLRLPTESHLSTNRAGFVLTVIGQDPTHSIELGFWTDRVWAYDIPAPNTFVRGPDGLYDTQGAAHTYRVAVANQQYTVSADGQALFGGSLVDFTSAPFPIYHQPNAIFFGDDTSSAAALAQVALITLTALPPVSEPSSAALLAVGLGVIAWLRRAKRRPAAPDVTAVTARP